MENPSGDFQLRMYLREYMKDKIFELRERCEDMIDHRSYKHNLATPEKNSVFNGIRTHELCDTGALFYQLSYQANWKLVTL